MFTKIQKSITGIPRQHYIPKRIHNFAIMEQMQHPGSPGKGRKDVPTLADIYYQLIIEGIALVEAGAKPVFVEVGRPDGSRAVQIKYPPEILNDDDVKPGKLNSIKKRAESGEFEFYPNKTISVLAIAVGLMEEAIQARETSAETLLAV